MPAGYSRPPSTHGAASLADNIYIHAKIAIVDDNWLTLGSANLNEHSLFNDTEMNIVSHDHELARRTRLRLWAEHLELPRNRSRLIRSRRSTSSGSRSARSSSSAVTTTTAHAPARPAAARLAAHRTRTRTSLRYPRRRLTVSLEPRVENIEEREQPLLGRRGTDRSYAVRRMRFSGRFCLCVVGLTQSKSGNR